MPADSHPPCRSAQLLVGCMLVLAALIGSTATAVDAGTTSATSAAFTYDAPTVVRADAAAEAGQSQLGVVRERSASPPAAVRGTSTTLLAPIVATNTADDAARFVVDSAGSTTLRAQGPSGWLNVSEHAAERMTQRGITIDALDSTLFQPSFQYWQPGANAGWRTGFYDPASRVFVTTANGEVVTVINNASQTYINNVMARVPPP